MGSQWLLVTGSLFCPRWLSMDSFVAAYPLPVRRVAFVWPNDLCSLLIFLVRNQCRQDRGGANFLLIVLVGRHIMMLNEARVKFAGNEVMAAHQLLMKG